MIGYGWVVFGFVSVAFGASAPDAPRFERELLDRAFLKGNTHSHSNRSDGDSPPEAVIRRYRDAGYAFLVLTDHDRASRPGEFAGLETPGTFTVISGEEITSGARASSEPSGPKWPVHVNSICASATVGGRILPSVRQALLDAVSRTRARGTRVAQVNHPNYYWALRAEDVAAVAGPVGGAALLEIANQHPAVRNDGDARHPSTEAIWDRVLSGGARIYGVASDDSHHFRPRTGSAIPLRGWIQVAAGVVDPAHSAESICSALASGRFYSSTGISITLVRVSGSELDLAIAPIEGTAPETVVTEFIGLGGQVLSRQSGLAPSYRLQGPEVYVRARVCGPKHLDGRPNCAWTQPEFITRASSP